MFGGKHPLSKIGGSQLKDIPAALLRENIELYRPPGIIKPLETALQAKSAISDTIIFTQPNAKLQRRGKEGERKEEKNERGGLGNTMGG